MKKSLAIFSVLISFAVHAGKLTLQQAIAEVEHAPKVERAQAAAAEASWKKVESYSGLLPSLGLSATQLFTRKYVLTDITLGSSPTPVTVPGIIPDTVYALNANWLIFDGLANIDRYRGLSAMERAGQAEAGWQRFQSQREVILLFYSALAAQTLRDVAAQNVKTLEEHLADVRLLKKTGLNTKYEVLRVEVQWSDARSDLLNALDGVAGTRLHLGEALGHPLEERELSGEVPTLGKEIIAKVAYDESQRLDLRALQEKGEGLRHLSDGASKHWSPKISLFAQYQEYNNRSRNPFDKDAFRSAYNAGVQIGWNFFEGFSSQAKDRQSIEQKIQAEKSLAIAQIKAVDDVEVWKQRYLYYCAVRDARLENIGRATESVRLAREGKKVGIRTNSELLDAELDLFRARAGFVNAQIGTVEALINLELATGQSLFKF